MNIIELKIAVNNLNEMKDFYSNILQLEMVKEESNEITFNIGVSKLSFVKSNQNSTYHFAFNIPNNQIQPAFEWLSDRVNVISDEGQQIIHFKSWNAHSIYFLDPQGNIVELIARHDLPNESSNTFSSKDLLCISEIGIASEDVLKDAEEVCKAVKIDYWRSPEITFTPIGDQNGLIIMVNKGRVWYMSDIVANQHPTEVIIAGTENKTHNISPNIRIITKIIE